MLRSVNVSGTFDVFSPPPFIFPEASSLSGSLLAEGFSARSGSLFLVAACPAAGTRNQECSLIAASRTEHCSIAATKSRTFPPTRPRTLEHDFDWQAQAPPTPLSRVAVKLSLLWSELCVGSGHRPRSEWAFTRRNGTP